MQKTIKSDGVDYKLSSEWDNERKEIKVSLDIKVCDWKKAKNLDTFLVEHDFPFRVTSFLTFGVEENWGYDPHTGNTDIDYSEVNLWLNVRSPDGKSLYSIEIKNPFYENLIFYIKPVD